MRPGVLRLDAEGGQPQQQIADARARQIAGEIDLAAAVNFNVTVGLKNAEFSPDFHAVSAADQGKDVGGLVSVAGAIDRQSGQVSHARVSGHRDARVAEVARRCRQVIHSP